MKKISFPAIAALVAFLASPAFAQTADDNQPDMVSPPRLAVAEGNVQFWRPGEDAWEPAALNAALAEGDAIYTGADGTVELQIGPRDFVRMTADTMLTLVNHDPGMMHFRLGSGTASFDMRGGRAGQLVRIDAETANIVVGGRGYYRISTREGETRLAVRNEGRATLTFADGRSRSIGAGEEIVVQGDGARVDVHAAPPPDSWDRWNDDRSAYYAAAVSNRYVPADVYGAADLDQYGRWREDGTYGWIWVPAVAVGWAPYSTGNWRWDPFYGWTWVDVAPWGWTTCHYGRWVFVNGFWAWAPGPRVAHVVYAPALVAFFQIDGGMSWVALGWGEPLVPWWGRPGFRGSIWWAGWGGPRPHYQHDHHDYRNRHVHNAFISVPEREFGHRHVRGSSLTPPRHIEPRLIRGDLPRFGPERERRRDATPPPRPRLEPVARPERPIEPQPRHEPQRRMPQPGAAPAPRPVEAIPPREQREHREQQRIEQRERPRFEPRGEGRVAPEPRAAVPAPMPAPAAPPVIQPRVVAPPEVRRERVEPREAPREWRREERMIQREPQRVEPPRMEPQRIQPQRVEPQRMEPQRFQPQRMEPQRVEVPRPQVQTPSAPEVQRRGPDRELGGNRERGRPHGPGERD
jgi:hypothetical protein